MLKNDQMVRAFTLTRTTFVLTGVQGADATAGEGLRAGYTWIQKRLAEKNQTNLPVVQVGKPEPHRWRGPFFQLVGYPENNRGV